MSFWAICAIMAGICSIMFRPTWIILGHVAVIFLQLLKWAIVLGLAFAVLNMPMAYKAMGWTPLSLIVGPQIYKNK